jgi:hypothetical protein
VSSSCGRCRFEEATTYLNRARHQLERRGIRTLAHISTSTPLVAIQAIQTRMRLGLIAMASHRYGSHRDRALNNISSRVIEQSDFRP